MDVIHLTIKTYVNLIDTPWWYFNREKKRQPHLPAGSLQIKRSNLVAFMYAQIFVRDFIKTGTYYGQSHN